MCPHRSQMRPFAAGDFRFLGTALYAGPVATVGGAADHPRRFIAIENALNLAAALGGNCLASVRSEALSAGLVHAPRGTGDLDKDRGCSPSTRAKHLRVLGACLQAAVSYR